MSDQIYGRYDQSAPVPARASRAKPDPWVHLPEVLKSRLPKIQLSADLFVKKFCAPTERRPVPLEWLKVIAEQSIGSALSTRWWIPQAFIEQAFRSAGYRFSRARDGKLSVFCRSASKDPLVWKFWRQGGDYPVSKKES